MARDRNEQESTRNNRADGKRKAKGTAGQMKEHETARGPPPSGRGRAKQKIRRTRLETDNGMYASKSPVKPGATRTSQRQRRAPIRYISEESGDEEETDGEDVFDAMVSDDTYAMVDFTDEGEEDTGVGWENAQRQRQERRDGLEPMVDEEGTLNAMAHEDSAVERTVDGIPPSTPPSSPHRERHRASTPMSVASSTEEAKAASAETKDSCEKESMEKRKKSESKHYKIQPARLVKGKRFFCSVDIEITGPKKNWDEMIQIGCILFEIGTNKIIATFDSLISVTVEIQYHAFKVHGISKDDVKDAPTSSEVMTKLIAFLNEHTNDEDYVVLVSHNGKVRLWLPLLEDNEKQRPFLLCIYILEE